MRRATGRDCAEAPHSKPDTNKQAVIRVKREISAEQTDNDRSDWGVFICLGHPTLRRQSEWAWEDGYENENRAGAGWSRTVNYKLANGGNRINTFN